jgi:hypothetical protein
VAALLSILGQLGIPDPGQDSSEELQRLLDVFYVLVGVGFLVAIAGHLFDSRTLVIVGIAMFFIGTAVFMVAVGAYG